MNGSDAAIPPPRVLQTALRTITERLANEIENPTPCAPDWSDFEWKMARAVAALHGASSLLAGVLRWQGPAPWRRFLDEQRDHTARRHERIAALLQILDERARGEGVRFVALKGAALHSMGLYAAGDRPMADIDLLVRPADTARACAMIESLGYRKPNTGWNALEFTPNDARIPAPLGEHAYNAIKIELHESIWEKFPMRIVDASDWIFPHDAAPGLNGYRSNASLMLHLLLHAAGSMSLRSLRLMHVHDIARLSARMSESDWQELLAQGPNGRPLWWAFPPLKIASRYYSNIPPPVLERLARACPYLLRSSAARRRLHDVSFSYLWVNAFPGLLWSQSLTNAARYVANRVLPGAALVARRGTLAQNEVWAQQDPWSRLSQRRRVARWLTSRQPRTSTMYVVCAALEHEDGVAG